jgi:cation transport protein ChaC
VHGLHRRFCLWTALGRGSPDQPGLVLGLDRGGRCRGLLYRIAAADVEAELDVVWRREMVTGAYRPRWVRAVGAAGSVNALTFVIERRHDRYAGPLGDERLVETLATARGALGSCADYLFDTILTSPVDSRDVSLERLLRAVRAHQIRAAPRLTA